MEDLDAACCSNGTEALDACHVNPLNVAIIDLRLPDMPGMDVTNLQIYKCTNLQIYLFSVDQSWVDYDVM